MLKQYTKSRILKIKISLLKLEKGLKELRDKELKDREIEIRKEIEEPFFQSVTVYIDDMDKSEDKEIMKRRLFAENTWYDWLTNYILEPIKKAMDCVKDNVMSPF